jgi:hypothetical protein
MEERRRGRYYRDRAAQLLRRLLEEPAFGPDRVADELAITLDDLDACRWGRIRMPLERQLCLALVVMTQVPRLARVGHSVYGHVCAAIRCATHTTAVHTKPPPGMEVAGTARRTGSTVTAPPARRVVMQSRCRSVVGRLASRPLDGRLH